MLESRIEIFRQALAELGDVPNDQLIAYIKEKYGVKIDPRYVRIFKASLLDRDQQARKVPFSPDGNDRGNPDTIRQAA